MTTPSPERKPVVWIVNESGHDYQPAEAFGRLMALSSENLNPFNVDRIAANFAVRLRMVEPDDYLLLSGSPIINIIAFDLWIRKFGRVNVLLFSQKSSGYVHRVLIGRNLDRLATSEASPA